MPDNSQRPIAEEPAPKTKPITRLPPPGSKGDRYLRRLMEHADREKPPMTSNEKPTAPSEPTSSSRSINSPEFRRSALRELRDMIEKGHIKSTQFELAEPQPNLPAAKKP